MSQSRSPEIRHVISQLDGVQALVRVDRIGGGPPPRRGKYNVYLPSGVVEGVEARSYSGAVHNAR